MIRGLYTSAWSMLALQKKMDIVSNNMANVNTSGYKKDTLVLESFPDLMTKIIKDYGGKPNTSRNIGTMELGSDVGEVFTNYTQGQITKTNNNLDMAIRDSNNAFFTVSMTDADGNVNEYYTRDGSFTKGSDGTLMTNDGCSVLGKNGPIKLESGDFIVGSDGTVQQNGETVDQLSITEFADTTQLKKFGNNLVTADANAATRQFTGLVEQGSTELSNVNIIKEMVDMITVTRSYEANQKVLQAQDGTLDKAVNEVGRVA
jgi:flagellar basal-body rod protein FlgF